MSDKKESNHNGKWGYASYYEDKDGKTQLIYTRIEKNGSVNRYKDNGDGGHGHSHWDKKEDFDAGKDPDWSRKESNDSPNPGTGEVQENTGCYLTTACMYRYKKEFDDNCHELSVLRWFRDKFVSLPDKYKYYKIAPEIVDALSKSKNQEKYYQYIYEHVVKECVEAIERGDYSFAYNRYRRTIQLLEIKFVAVKEFNKSINTAENRIEIEEDRSVEEK